MTAKQSNIKSLQYAFRDRKNRKRSFRSLWISRINAGSRELGVFIQFVNGPNNKNILINRKVLSDISISDNDTFKKIVDLAIN